MRPAGTGSTKFVFRDLGRCRRHLGQHETDDVEASSQHGLRGVADGPAEIASHEWERDASRRDAQGEDRVLQPEEKPQVWFRHRMQEEEFPLTPRLTLVIPADLL